MKRTFCIQLIVALYIGFQFRCVSDEELATIRDFWGNTDLSQLENQLPFLKNIDASTLTKENSEDWIGDIARKYHTWHELSSVY